MGQNSFCFKSTKESSLFIIRRSSHKFYFFYYMIEYKILVENFLILLFHQVEVFIFNFCFSNLVYIFFFKVQHIDIIKLCFQYFLFYSSSILSHFLNISDYFLPLHYQLPVQSLLLPLLSKLQRALFFLQPHSTLKAAYFHQFISQALQDAPSEFLFPFPYK